MNDITRFLKRLTAITLSDNERLALRERLTLYTDMHPVIAPAPVPVASFFSFFASRRFSTYALSLVLVIAAGGGITLASEGSVPGDSLYDIKIHVNEPLMTAFAGTPTGQAKVAADIATRRIDEAVTLASRGELTTDKEAYLTHEFNARVKVAAQKADELATLDSRAADSVKADLAANLAGEAQALGAVGKGKHATTDLLRTVVATSESISDAEDTGRIATATSSPQGTVATSTEAVPTVHLERVRLTAQVASTTPAARAFVPRFAQHLHFTATTTFSGRLASTTLQTTTLLAPRMDLAIPSPSDRTESRDGSDHTE